MAVIDSNLPRFSQAMQSLLLAIAFVLDLRWMVPVLAVVLTLAVIGGPKWNALAYLYKALPIPRGEPEPAAPPRFAQLIGAVFLIAGSVGLYSLTPETTSWWVLGWGPALIVAVLAGVAAATTFCLGCEMFLLAQRLRAR
ncbi:MAG: DUF4395 domain-containing protein [Actinomycetota bacterium]